MKVKYTVNGEEKTGTIVWTKGNRCIIIPDDHTAHVITNKDETHEIV